MIQTRFTDNGYTYDVTVDSKEIKISSGYSNFNGEDFRLHTIPLSYDAFFKLTRLVTAAQSVEEKEDNF